jgi:hypothetical protein
MSDLVTLILSEFEFEIFDPDGISFLKTELSQQCDAALSFDIVIEISDGTAVCEIS